VCSSTTSTTATITNVIATTTTTTITTTTTTATINTTTTHHLPSCQPTRTHSPPSQLSFELFLPTKLYYAPPLNIRVFDNRKFGRKPLVGVHSIPNVMDFLIEERIRRNTELAAIK
jgi:hypothetical protein